MREVETETNVEGQMEPIIPTRGLDETVELGREIYERDIRHKVEPDNVGKVCAIDVDSGNWALGDNTVVTDVRVAVKRLRERRPEAVNVYCERVGYKALRSFGGGFRRRVDLSKGR